MRKSVAAVFAATAMLIFAATGWAGGSSLLAGHGSAPQSPTHAVAGTKAALGNAAPVKGGLPFTGRDLSLIFAGGLAVMVVGFGLRRVTRQRG